MIGVPSVRSHTGVPSLASNAKTWFAIAASNTRSRVRTARQRDTGHDQGLRLGAAAIARQRQQEEPPDAATAGRRGGEHAFLGVRAAAIIAVGAVEDGDVHVGENSCVAV